LLHPQGLEPLLPSLVLQALKSSAEIDLHVLGFELRIQEGGLTRLEQVAEFSSLEMVDDNIPFDFRVFAAEFGNGNESARFKRTLVQQFRGKFPRERRLGNQALQQDSDQSQFRRLRSAVQPSGRSGPCTSAYRADLGELRRFFLGHAGAIGYRLEELQLQGPGRNLRGPQEFSYRRAP